MSERLIISHYENNYGGAVKRLNLIGEKLAELDYANAPGFLINGLKVIKASPMQPSRKRLQ
jgi:Fe-Mn family superoxide dismutase